MLWSFQEGDFFYKYLNEASTPYHIDCEGCLSGFGKKIKLSKNKLTVCEVLEGKWVFVGDESGYLHVCDWKFGSHVKTFLQHAAPILTIKVD